MSTLTSMLHRALLLSAAMGIAGTASAARLDVTAATASSEYPAEGGMSYEAKKLIDGKLSTAWVEGEDGAGLGASVVLDLGSVKEVQKIKVWGGIWYSVTNFERANRVKELEIQFDDGSKELLRIEDGMQVAELQLSAAKKTQKIKLVLKGTHSGTTWNDTGISEVQVFDSAPESFVKVVKVEASSTMPSDADGSYEASNVADGIIDSMWCEGKKDADGTGESLTLSFAGKNQVSQLSVVNGVGTSLSFWMKSNRTGKLTLSFDDGSSQVVALKNSMMPQTVKFTPVTTGSVKVSLTEVVAGKEYNDTCLSELMFQE